jgi:hypothetical protein
MIQLKLGAPTLLIWLMVVTLTTTMQGQTMKVYLTKLNS